jgi:hypothetical protein
MKGALRGIYYFLPVQLLFLHFRKYQILLVFWLILLLTITGNFAARFGAMSLLLAPEYLGHISFASMFLIGCSVGVFIMAWHITTFIIHSKRIPYMGETRHAFVIYCINNSIIPLVFSVFYSVVSIRFQWKNEHMPTREVLLLQSGYYLGFVFILVISFAYFFRVSRDFFKSLLSTIAKPSRIRRVIPYDKLDFDVDMIPAKYYINRHLRIGTTEGHSPFQPRVMITIMERHHRNVIFAAFVAYVALLVLGINMEQPLLRIPAGAGFVLLFSIFMGFVGAFQYFLKSWEALGWIAFVCLLSVLVKYGLFDVRSIAYGLNYQVAAERQPTYNYNNLQALFTPEKYYADAKAEESRLDQWQAARAGSNDSTLVILTSSGGGLRSCYWTFNALQYADSLSKGRLFANTVMITGASGGMLGAAYWRAVHDGWLLHQYPSPYAQRFVDNIGKDLLNSIVFSLASVDLISPFNKISLGGYAYTRDRGYAMEQEMARNTEGILDKTLGYYRAREAAGTIPQLMIGATIVNDGRKLIMCNQPVGYMTQPEYSLNDHSPPIDAVDFAAFFKHNDPYNLRIPSALRMTSTFPFVLPVVRMPCQPVMNIMDAGLRDNFGVELSSRYLYAMRHWIDSHIKHVVFLEIRDSREFDVCSSSDQSTLGGMMTDPLFVIQNKWESIQSYKHSFIKEYAPHFLKTQLHFVMLSYVPSNQNKSAALNFHLTLKEKEDIYASIFNQDNQEAMDTLLRILR